MACQIMERNYEEKRILLAGVRNGGEQIADQLRNEMCALNPDLDVVATFISMEKARPVVASVDIGTDLQAWTDGVVVVVDDVAHSGKTLLYALKPFMVTVPRKLQCAVLVDRAHKHFPVHADFVGLSLATMMQERVEVLILPDGGGIRVYLH